MNAKADRNKKHKFIQDLEAVSASLAVWAQSRFIDDWSIEDVKAQIRTVAKFCEKDI